jgi:hypothetical protein
VLPDDDAGREDLVILLNHVAHNRTDARGKMLGFGLRWAPWMPGTESAALVDMILAKPRKYSPTTLGRLTRLTEAERDQESITTFRAFDSTPESMALNAARKDREYQKAKRDENRSGRPRGRPKSASVPAWVAAGYSNERSYYRHKARGTVAAQSGSKNESGALDVHSYAPDGISLPPVSPDRLRGAQQARPRHAPILDDLDDDGDGLMPPPPTNRTCGQSGLPDHQW